jgi:hypothetical protein
LLRKSCVKAATAILDRLLTSKQIFKAGFEEELHKEDRKVLQGVSFVTLGLRVAKSRNDFGSQNKAKNREEDTCDTSENSMAGFLAG